MAVVDRFLAWFLVIARGWFFAVGMPCAERIVSPPESFRARPTSDGERLSQFLEGSTPRDVVVAVLLGEFDGGGPTS